MIRIAPRYTPWVAGVAIWTALPLLFATQTALWLSYRDEPVVWGDLLTYRIADWYTCGLFVPLLVWVTRRWPVDLQHITTRLPTHVMLLVAVSAGKIAIFEPVSGLLGLRQLGFTNSLVRGLISEFVAFAATAAAIHALEFYRRYREREVLSQQLQERLTDAQLRALRAQLNPHFLFNTLNAVTTLVHRDPNRADAMLTRLGELLRLTLRSDPDHEIPLNEELAMLERYVDIMRMRFPDRLTVHTTIDPSVAQALVPSFVLQPIIENAFEHGVARMNGPATIDVEAAPSTDGRFVVLRVRDNGPGLSASRPNDSGVGLANTQQRLAGMYGSEATFAISPASNGSGTLVEMRFPRRQ